MDNTPTSWDIDEISEETLSRLRQYTPTEEEMKEIENERKEKVVKLGDLLNEIADFSEKFISELTMYSNTGGHVIANPLLEEAPYSMSNPSFVYWCFEASRVPLHESKERHTTRDIVHSPRLETVYPVGSSVNLEGLLRGDLLFFNNDRHVGIYLGDGEFVSMDGPDSRSSAGGVKRNNLEDEYWSSIFKGHVKRLVR